MRDRIREASLTYAYSDPNEPVGEHGGAGGGETGTDDWREQNIKISATWFGSEVEFTPTADATWDTKPRYCFGLALVKRPPSPSKSSLPGTAGRYSWRVVST